MPRTKRDGKKIIKSKRTKPPLKQNREKMKKLKPTKWHKQPEIHPMGGCLLNPPNNCPKRMIHPWDKGIKAYWADLNYCYCCCPFSYKGRVGNNTCERHKWFCKASDLEKAKEWKRWKVKSFGFGKWNNDNIIIRTKHSGKRK